MNTGKIPETILKRSVFKQIRHRRDEVIVRPGVGEDCSVIELADDEVIVLSTDPITGTADEIGTYAVHITVNDIAASGAEPIGIMVTILMPSPAEEKNLKQLIKSMEAECADLGIEILGGHTEVTPVVNQIVVTVTGVGKLKKCEVMQKRKMRAGQEVVMTKWIGLEGTSIIANAREDELKTKYTSEVIDKAKSFIEMISIKREAEIAKRFKISSMHDVTEGGIFGALWEIASAANLGIEADLNKIPVKAETIEICEYFDLNPYLLISSGSLIIVTEEANRLVEALEKEGIKASVIARLTEGNERVVFNEDEKRYLEPPKTDELYKAI